MSTAQTAAPTQDRPGKDPLARLTKAGTLLLFGATWCAPAVLLEGPLAALPDSVDVRRIDIDAWPQHAETFQVLSLPTLVWMREGRERRRHIGAISGKELAAFTSRK